MTKTCCLCGKHQGLLSKLIAISENAYCKKCYANTFSQLEWHPISNEMINTPYFITSSNFDIANRDLLIKESHRTIGLHVFFYKSYIEETRGTFIGIDKSNGQLFLVDYKFPLADEYHVTCTFTPISMLEFKNSLCTYPLYIQRAFCDFSHENWQNYLSTNIKQDLNLHMIFLVYKSDELTKYIYAYKNAGVSFSKWFLHYLEIDTNKLNASFAFADSLLDDAYRIDSLKAISQSYQCIKLSADEEKYLLDFLAPFIQNSTANEHISNANFLISSNCSTCLLEQHLSEQDLNTLTSFAKRALSRH